MSKNHPSDGHGYRVGVGGVTVEAVAEDFDVTEERATELLGELEDRGIVQWDPSKEAFVLASPTKALAFWTKTKAKDTLASQRYLGGEGDHE